MGESKRGLLKWAPWKRARSSATKLGAGVVRCFGREWALKPRSWTRTGASGSKFGRQLFGGPELLWPGSARPARHRPHRLPRQIRADGNTRVLRSPSPEISWPVKIPKDPRSRHFGPAMRSPVGRLAAGPSLGGALVGAGMAPLRGVAHCGEALPGAVVHRALLRTTPAPRHARRVQIPGQTSCRVGQAWEKPCRSLSGRTRATSAKLVRVWPNFPRVGPLRGGPGEIQPGVVLHARARRSSVANN